MKSILASFPGKYGDVLWALPTIRAISERYHTPVTLVLSATYGQHGFADLLNAQDYCRVVVDPEWHPIEGAETAAQVPPCAKTPPYCDYHYQLHLSYRGWPQLPLPVATQMLAQQSLDELLIIDLRRPWITVSTPYALQGLVAVGFSDDWFELKFGLVQLLRRAGVPIAATCFAYGSRWDREASQEQSADWMRVARVFAGSRVVLACNSALHVLAVALGRPVVMMEPSEARWNDIFYPLGRTGPQVTVVMGNDGRPTFDARHVKDTLTDVLRTAPLLTGDLV